MISGSICGRPRRFDFQAQRRANPRRCHRITVSGLTIARLCTHRDQARESTIQNARFSGVSRARFRLTAQDRELLSQLEVFGDQAHSRAERRPECADDRHEQRDHVGTLAHSVRIVSGESAPSVR
jgi:hypothetical protein